MSIENRRLHALLPQRARHVEAVAPGQHDVEDDDVERLGGRPLDGDVAVAGGFDAIALGDQAIAQRQLESGFVFDEQQAGGGTSVGWCRRPPQVRAESPASLPGRAGRSCTPGRSMVNVLPRPRFAVHRHLTAVCFDDPLHEMQPEAAALNLPRHRLASAIERLEDVLAILGRDANAAILDGDPRGAGARSAVAATRTHGDSPPYLIALLMRF